MDINSETLAQFALRVGLSQERIAQLIKEGLPRLINRHINVDNALAWMEQNSANQQSIPHLRQTK